MKKEEKAGTKAETKAETEKTVKHMTDTEVKKIGVKISKKIQNMVKGYDRKMFYSLTLSFDDRQNEVVTLFDNYKTASQRIEMGSSVLEIIVGQIFENAETALNVIRAANRVVGEKRNEKK